MRYYGEWAGNPKGTPEDPARCRAEVWDPRTQRSHQCQRKRISDLCLQHYRRRIKGQHVRIPDDATAPAAAQLSQFRAPRSGQLSEDLPGNY